MNAAIVTCATGPFGRMTERWARSARLSRGGPKVLVFAQDLRPRVPYEACDEVCLNEVNLGFAGGMNAAIRRARYLFDPEWIVIANNDCAFPRVNWLEVLLDDAQPGKVYCPTNTKCNTSAAVAQGPTELPEFALTFVPAVCWALHRQLLAKIRSGFGYELFDPAFKTGWAEDNYAAAVLQTLCGPRPFIVRPKSWIEHHGSITVSHQIKKRGTEWTKENEKLLRGKLATLKDSSRPIWPEESSSNKPKSTSSS